MATQSNLSDEMSALSNQVDTLIAEIGGRKFKGDEAANLKNLLNGIRSKLESFEIDTGGEEYLLLKWGTLKSWEFTKPTTQALFKQYAELGMTMGAMSQKDTEKQKEIICHIIDELDGTIQNDWDGDYYTKSEAKKYVKEYSA